MVSHSQRRKMDSETATTLSRPVESSPGRVSQSGHKWPVSFWAVLKLLAVFYHRDLVTNRRCFSCRVVDFHKKKDYLTINDHHCPSVYPGKQAVKVSLALAYESNSTPDLNNEESYPLLEPVVSEPACEACKIQWWNHSGESHRYTEKEIGGRAWNHRGSAILSTLMNVCCIAVVIFDASYYMPKMWAKSDQTLHMLNKAAFFSFALSYPVLSLCSKIRSFIVDDAPYLSWTSTLNARYLVKRAQFHNLSKEGLPGKFFFSLCIILPIACALHRGWIYIYLSECPHNFPHDFHVITTTAIGLFFYETIGCFIYIVYLIRTSFQRQFSLLLSYIKEEEGNKGKCLCALFTLTTDYTCFKNFCSICFLYCLPAGVLAITSNLAWQYIVNEVCSSGVDKRALVIEDNISLNVWSVVVMFLFLLTYATGGLSVEYIWDDFRSDLLQLQSEQHSEFWKQLTCQVSSLYQSKDTLTATLVFSLVSFFMALQLGDQDVSYLATACNGTDLNITKHYCY